MNEKVDHTNITAISPINILYFYIPLCHAIEGTLTAFDANFEKSNPERYKYKEKQIQIKEATFFDFL